ncbi:acyl-CoA N-acyltransferase [Karstenula rhodostoma CBS 690.94]|uniref:Acyl-CoA N-acyltransferase n=1 Tax=Karstenula rhodostoma CBS 690.94 TaxID=1392251 RepID=A0A9P4P965_9PLEO|nr:acyl-CoA N-acyltransferase [Karstenula rhodostoma CBS 690.94]
MADPKQDASATHAQQPNAAPRVSKPTLPVEEKNRLKDEEICIEMCTIDDMPAIAEQLYICFPDAFWDKMEPPALRSADAATRVRRLATRLSPSFHLPEMKWIKAVYRPTGKMVGVAGWMVPGYREGMPIHNVWRRSATDFFGFAPKMNWSDADIEEMWRGVDIAQWDGHIGGNDDIRAAVLGDEPHWFLAPLMTLPEWQGRGVASKLMRWAIEQADGEGGQAMYLESAPTARNVYLRFGFEPLGEANMIRRGPRRGGVGGVEAGEKVGLGVVEVEVEHGAVS